MQLSKTNDFIFLRRYRLWRHILFWIVHTIMWSAFWVFMKVPAPFERELVYMGIWIPVLILFSYPLVYGAIPHLLLKGRVLLFILTVIGWGFVGLYIDEAGRSYIIIPFQHAWGYDNYAAEGLVAVCYLCMISSAASLMVLKFFKLWALKQQAWREAQQEKIMAELQLLKAQLQPHFLFNTLNNIYAFALESSPKTPHLVLKLSSLLSYVLYECKSEQVLLEKELEVMKNYMDLEKERYGDKIDLSVSIEGDLQYKYITPLLILPFLENAFKHGTSEQLDRPWMSVTIVVKDNFLWCKVVNSKNEVVPDNDNGVGINNVKKRLEFLYPGKHELRLSDLGVYFVVSLRLELDESSKEPEVPVIQMQQLKKVYT